jgi:perosamine synthetase
LKKLEKFTKKRQKNAKYYKERLKGVQLPIEEEGNKHVYHLFTVRVTKKRDQIASKLNKGGIGTGIHYPTPIHKQPYYKKLGYSKASLPEAEKASKEVLSLPVHPEVTSKNIKYISMTLNKLIENI